MNRPTFEDYLRYALENPAPNLDWRDDQAYAFIERVPNEKLAWEFLRRNPEYRADFQNWFDGWHAIGGFHSSESSNEWLVVERQMTALCERWSLWPLYGPGVPWSLVSPEFKDEQAPRSPRIMSYCIDGRVNDRSRGMSDYSPSMTVQILLDQPLNEQLEGVKRLVTLLAKQYDIKLPRLGRNDSRRRKGKYGRYLQVLDARLSGVSPAEIGRQFYGGGRDGGLAVKDDLDTAQALSSQGYMNLFRLPERSGTERRER